MVIFNRKSKQISGLENSVIQLTVSFLTVAIFVGFKQAFVIHVPYEAWVWIFILGVVNTGLGCYLYFSPLAKLQVQTVAICGYLEPLSAVIFASFRGKHDNAANGRRSLYYRRSHDGRTHKKSHKQISAQRLKGSCQGAKKKRRIKMKGCPRGLFAFKFFIRGAAHHTHRKMRKKLILLSFFNSCLIKACRLRTLCVLFCLSFFSLPMLLTSQI